MVKKFRMVLILMILIVLEQAMKIDLNYYEPMEALFIQQLKMDKLLILMLSVIVN